jgi:DedD protein
VDGKLKQRVIGVVVLTALAVIILPLLLDGTEEERQRIVQRVPSVPTLEVINVDPKAMIAEMDRIEADSKARLPREVEPSDDVQTSQSSLDVNGLPNGWSLQVGSFAERKNAFQLRDQLRKKGFRTYAVTVATEAGERVRVLVGPSLQRSRIEKIKVQIEADFELVCKIVRYDIEDDSGQLGG